MAVERLAAEEVHLDEEDSAQAEADEVHREAEADLQEQEEGSRVVVLPSREAHREADRGEVVEGVEATDSGTPSLCIRTLSIPASVSLLPCCRISFPVRYLLYLYPAKRSQNLRHQSRIVDHASYTLPIKTTIQLP